MASNHSRQQPSHRPRRLQSQALSSGSSSGTSPSKPMPGNRGWPKLCALWLEYWAASLLRDREKLLSHLDYSWAISRTLQEARFQWKSTLPTPNRLVSSFVRVITNHFVLWPAQSAPAANWQVQKHRPKRADPGRQTAKRWCCGINSAPSISHVANSSELTTIENISALICFWYAGVHSFYSPNQTNFKIKMAIRNNDMSNSWIVKFWRKSPKSLYWVQHHAIPLIERAGVG